MKTRYFFGETSPQTFVTKGLRLIPIVLGGTICCLKCEIRPASIFGELSAARKFGG